MNIKKRICITFLAICLCFSVSGCWDQKIYERTGFILQMGVERGLVDAYLFTVTSPVVEEESKKNVEIIKNEGNLVRESQEKSRHRSGKMLQGGKIQLYYFSDEVAREGIHELLETFERNPENPLLAHVVVVDGSPSQMIEASAEFKDQPRSAYYINNLLENARSSAYTPETRIYRFDIDFFAPGIDPITPMISLQQDAIQVMGSALFSDDRMVGKINTQQTGLLLAMKNEQKQIEFFYLEEKASITKKGVALTIKPTKRKINIEFIDNEPAVNIDITLDGTLNEYERQHMMDKPEEVKKLEQKLSEQISKECTLLFEYMQKVGSDPIGIGNMIRWKYNQYWQTIDWKKIYPEMQIQIKAKVNIKHYGATN